MNFRAKIRRPSPIHRHWTDTSKIGGTIHGVRFKKAGARDFVSVDDPLPPDAVSALLSHPDVELEVTTAPAGGVAAVEEDQADREEGTDNPAEDPPDEARTSSDPFSANYVPPGSARDPKSEPVMRRPVGRPPRLRP